MLVKRKNPLSDVFDAYSEHESDETLWPEDGPLPPAVEPSGYRPAPSGFIEAPKSDVSELDASTADLTELDASTSDFTELDASTSEVTELDAPASSVPTPRRALVWALNELDPETPLPVVTAATEPTQRGLGIPPPPSAKEAAWFAQLPSLASVPPPSPEAFTDRGAPAAQSLEPARETSENERITVRAPAGPSDRVFTGRRRAVAILLLAATALSAGLVMRRTNAPGPTVKPTMARATPAPAGPTAASAHEASLPPPAEARNTAALDTAEPAPPEAASDRDEKRAPGRHRSGKESRREKARRKALAAAKVRPSVVADHTANLPDLDVAPAPATAAKLPERREVLSLPPR